MRRVIDKLSISKFLSWFKRVPTLEGLEFAFNCGGKTFYKWKVTENMPILRLMMAKDYLDMLEIGAERQDVIAYLQTVQEAIKGDKIDKYKLAIVTEQLTQRLQMATNTEILYKLAGVYFVEANEKMESTTIDEVEEKAEFFKASMPIDRFFLASRLRDFLPHGNTSELNLQAFSKAESIERKERLTSLLLWLTSLTDTETTTGLYLSQEVEKLQK